MTVLHPPVQYRPRHAAFNPMITIGPQARELYLADRFEEMLISLSPPVGRHRKGATNWFAYCMALRGVIAVLRHQVPDGRV